MSQDVAEELYPIAVRQARAEALRGLAAAVIVGVVALAALEAGYSGWVCIVGSLSSGVPAVKYAITRWKRLGHMRPAEAAAQEEL